MSGTPRGTEEGMSDETRQDGVLTAELFEDLITRAFSHIHFECDENGRLVGAHDQPFARLRRHDRDLRARLVALDSKLRSVAGERDHYIRTAEMSYATQKSLRERAEKAEAERDHWSEWAKESRCIYCGTVIPNPLDDTQRQADRLKREHVASCEAHPLRKAEAENEKLAGLIVEWYESNEVALVNDTMENGRRAAHAAQALVEVALAERRRG